MENEYCFKEEVVDIFRVYKDVRCLFLCKEWCEVGLLEFLFGDFIRKCEMEI